MFAFALVWVLAFVGLRVGFLCLLLFCGLWCSGLPMVLFVLGFGVSGFVCLLDLGGF